jgi:ABC-type branched-subunit amino acid transport system permease subunit
MARDRTFLAFFPALVVLVALGFLVPGWLRFLLTLGLAKGLVALGLVVMMRAGLVSFGQGLYFGLGAYAAGLAANFYGVSDAFALLALGGIAAMLIAIPLGALITGYREIFFAMFSLALSMILYGILVRSAWLGSTDGFNLPPPSFFGFRLAAETTQILLFDLTVLTVTAVAFLLHLFVRSPSGVIGEAIQSNEIRVEYLGTSVAAVLRTTYTLGALAAGLGGALVAMATRHIDPDVAYWTTSGEFVFVAILSGTGHVAAPVIGMVLFEAVRSFAFQYAPYSWQMVVGLSMLAVILFLPAGLWSLTKRRRAGRGEA